MQETRKSTLDQFRDREKDGSHSVYPEYRQADYEKFEAIPNSWDIKN